MCIGIFDSGVGGLNLAHQIMQLLPDADMIYFGDTAHLPYGEKSKSAIINYSSMIADYLLSRGCTTLVIACNSASAAAKDHLQHNIKKSINIIDVISPVASHVAKEYKHQSIGILATQATIDSGQYPKEIQQYTDSIHCVPLPAPLLAAAIENNQEDVIVDLLKRHLQAAQNLDALILGCTHYPLIQAIIRNELPKKVQIIDGTMMIAKAVAKKHTSVENGRREFFVSDYTQSFADRASRFFGESIQLKAHGIWAKK